jgi:hypothetical protein
MLTTTVHTSPDGRVRASAPAGSACVDSNVAPGSSCARSGRVDRHKCTHLHAYLQHVLDVLPATRCQRGLNLYEQSTRI